MNKTETLKAAPAHIVHFGAGICNELEHYLQSGAKQITLVEADPLTCKRLEQGLKNQQQVKVIQAAVAATSAKDSLFVYNLPTTNSLRKATGLYDIYPGLKLKTEIPVTTISPEELLQPLELDSQQTNWLTIDTPGEELSIMQAMHDAGHLEYFNLLNIYCGTGSFYQDSADAHTVLQQLQNWGYELVTQDNLSDPDRPCWKFQRNPLFPELRTAKEKLRELQQELDKANKAKTEQVELLQQIETVNQELAESRQTASNNAKLLKLKENDLKELQQRYKQSIKAQEQQHQLLMQIGERLQLASKYFHDAEGMPVKDIQEQHQMKNNDKTTAKKTKQSGKAKGKP